MRSSGSGFEGFLRTFGASKDQAGEWSQGSTRALRSWKPALPYICPLMILSR